MVVRGCFAEAPIIEGAHQKQRLPLGQRTQEICDARASFEALALGVPFWVTMRWGAPADSPVKLVAPIRVGGVRPRDERSRRLDLSRAFFSGQCIEATRLRNSHREQIRSTQSEELRKASKASMSSVMFGLIEKASMVGFTLLSRSYYYLRRRSPGPPFPPDHRQADKRYLSYLILSVRGTGGYYI